MLDKYNTIIATPKAILDNTSAAPDDFTKSKISAVIANTTPTPCDIAFAISSPNDVFFITCCYLS